MKDLLVFGARNALLVAVWCGVFAVAAIIAGIPASRWVTRRQRRASANSAARSRARVWCVRLIVVVGCFVAPVVVATFHAIPFAIERSLATGLEQAAPGAVGFVADLSTTRVMSMLGVRDEDAAVDALALKARVSIALAAAQARTDAKSTWIWIEAAAETQCLTLVHQALDVMGPADGRVTWREVAARARALASSGGTALSSSLAVPLRAAAAAHIFWAALTIAACNLLSVLLARVIV